MFYVRPQLLTSPYHTQENPLCNSMRHKETTIVKTQKHQAVHKKNKQIHRNRTDSQRVIELLSLLYNVLCASNAFCQSNNQVPSIYHIYRHLAASPGHGGPRLPSATTSQIDNHMWTSSYAGSPTFTALCVCIELRVAATRF